MSTACNRLQETPWKEVEKESTRRKRGTTHDKCNLKGIMMIFEILNRSEDEAISMRELAARTGMNERKIRKIVHDERRAGYPILSGIHGYYLPAADPEIAKHQLEAFKHEQQAHGRAHFATVAAVCGKSPQVAADALRKIQSEEGGADE